MDAKSQITTFIFDCFGVVCDPMLMGWYKKMSLKHGFVDKNIHDVFNQHDLGFLSEDNILEHFLRYPGINSTKDELREEVDGYIKLDLALVSIIKGLKQKGFKIVLLSNANHSLFERKIYSAYPEFKSLFDEIIISSLVGMIKPNADIFLHTLEKITAKPEEAIFVDDSAVNVEAAISLGIHGYVYTDSVGFGEYLTKEGYER